MRDHSFLSTLKHTVYIHEPAANIAVVLQYMCVLYEPVFGRDVSQLLQLPLLVHSSGLPPLVISAVQHMKNLPEVKVQSLRQDAAVPLLIVVKQRPENIRSRTHSYGFIYVDWTASGELPAQVC